MGYRTYYKLDILEGGEDYTLAQILEKEPELREAGSFDLDGNGTQAVTWNNEMEDMKALSEKYPSFVFQMDGDGEAVDDLWKTYYKNGHYQHTHARVIFDDYVEDALEEIDNT